jgi:hypothetical protein
MEEPEIIQKGIPKPSIMRAMMYMGTVQGLIFGETATSREDVPPLAKAWRKAPTTLTKDPNMIDHLLPHV